MTELLKSYLDTARILKNRILQLSDEIKTESDIDRLNSLEARKQLLTEERYDMLGIATQMYEYIKGKDAASGEC